MKLIALLTLATVLLSTYLPAALDPARYPPTERILIASIPVRVTPAREMTVVSPAAGDLTLFIEPTERYQNEGTLWAGIELERLDLERKVLEMTEQLLRIKEIPDWEIAIAKEKTAIENSIAKLESEVALLRKLMANPELSELYLGGESGLDHSPGESAEGMLERTQNELELIREYRKFLGSDLQRELEIGLIEAKFSQTKLDFERRERASRLTMPFNGEIRFLVPVRRGMKKIEVQAGEEVAILQDLSSIRIQLPVQNPQWRIFPVERLELQLQGYNVAGDFLERSVVAGQGREDLLYIFDIRPDMLTAARPLIGGFITGNLWYRHPEQMRMVPKLTAIMEAPDIFREGGWDQLIAHIAPGWEVATIGQTHVGLIRKNSTGSPQ